jgi:SOS-response transcriptional repressor LexA
MIRLTVRQKEIMQFILTYRTVHDTLPNRQRIRKHFGWSSPNSAVQAVQLLVKKGYLEWDDNPVGFKLSQEVKDRLIKRTLNDYKRKQTDKDK